jgi:hypothetical protein
MTTSQSINERFLKAVEAITGDTSAGKHTKATIAESIGSTNSNINRLASEPTRSITVEQCARFCDKYGVSTEWLLLGKGPMRGHEETIQITITSNSNSPVIKKVIKGLTDHAKKTIKV